MFPLKHSSVDHAGEFAIINCGVQNGGLVHTLLDELPGVLLPAVQDAESTQGGAFQAFFKSAEQGAGVSNILAKIAQGAPVFPADQFTNGAPGFMCIAGKGQVVGKTRQTGEPIDFFDTCGEFTAAAYFPGTKWIILCPIFFTAPMLINSPPAPPADNQPAPNCLRTSRRGIQLDGTRDNRHGAGQLVQYKVWVLLEELAHAYISVAEGDEENPSDIYDANAMFFLSAEDSVQNAASYVAYVASESPSPPHLSIRFE